VCEATGVARSTIGRGLAELRGGENRLGGRVRRADGGRKAAIDRHAGLLQALGELVQSAIRGDPQAALLWVSKSQRHLAGALAERGFVGGRELRSKSEPEPVRAHDFKIPELGKSLPLRKRCESGGGALRGL
jgi:hypothetical protein